MQEKSTPKLTFVVMPKKEGALLCFYDNYKTLCKNLGKSPSGVALELGISKSTVTKWKNGVVPTPSGSILQRIAEYFDVSVDELIGIKKEPAPKDELDAELVRLLSELPSSELPLVLAFVQGLAAKRGG